VQIVKPTTLQEALELLEKNQEGEIFAGGSDIIVSLLEKKPNFLIDITHISSLQQIQQQKGQLFLGALTTINTLLENPLIQNYTPLLYEASQNFASHQVRNLATIGGNITNNSPVADLIAPLLVLNTQVVLSQKNKQRTIPLQELIQQYKTLQLHQEILTTFIVPFQNGFHYYRKVGMRQKLSIAKVALALYKTDTHTFVSANGVNKFVQRLSHVETLLNQKNFTKKQLQEAIVLDTNPHSKKEYKRRVLFNMLGDALSLW